MKRERESLNGAQESRCLINLHQKDTFFFSNFSKVPQIDKYNDYLVSTIDSGQQGGWTNKNNNQSKEAIGVSE